MSLLDFKKFVYPLFAVFEGMPGRNGLTPYVGENGNWWIGDYDTGKPSVNTEKLQELIDRIDSILVADVQRIDLGNEGGKVVIGLRTEGKWEITIEENNE